MIGMLSLWTLAMATACSEQDGVHVVDDRRSDISHPVRKSAEATEAAEPTAEAQAPPATPLEVSIYDLEGIWNTHRGRQIELKELKGDVLVAVMIYTSCQAACPRLIADMHAIEQKVAAVADHGVRYIFVSIDPEVDTPEKLAKLADEVGMTGKQWVFLQGTERDVRYFANVLAVKYKRISPMDFSHANIISVFDRRGGLAHQQEGLSVSNKKTVDKVIELWRERPQ